MQMSSLTRWSLALTLAGALLASPADAQGKSKEKRKDKNRARPELVRRDDSSKAREKALKHEQKLREERLKDEYERRREVLKRDRDRYEDRDDRWDRDDDRWDYGDDDRRRRDVPPGWCKGKGNPHNTPENCGYGASRRDDRYGDRNEPYYGDRGGSYERDHQIFHDRHDRECRMRAAERPLDLQWQIRVRQECKARHDDWHRRTGSRHG